MNESSKSKQVLTEELESLKRRIRELEQAEARWKQVEAALNKSEETFRNLIENAPDAIYVHADARFLYLNPMAATLFGTASTDQLIGSPLMDRFHPSCHAMIRERLHLLYEENRALPIVEQTYIRLDGSPVPVEAHAVPITYNHQKASLTFARDISQRKRAEELLRESEKRYRELTDFLPMSFVEVDAAGSIISYNHTALEVFRYNEEDYKEGMNALQFFAPEERQRVGEKMEKVIQGTSTPGQEFTFLRKDGSKFIGLIYASPNIHQNKTVGIRGAVIDITERKRAEEALRESEERYRELSIVDGLTQLCNSRHFYNQLKMEIDRADRYGQSLTLLLLDLDDFKRFNDAYGHVEGDQVLLRLGQVVKRCLRQTDSAYRYGGEEFTILLPMTTSADGAVTAERIRTEFKKEHFSPAPGHDVHVTVSIGLAQYKPQEDMKAFVHRADQLMYQGKKNGKDRVCSEL